MYIRFGCSFGSWFGLGLQRSRLAIGITIHYPGCVSGGEAAVNDSSQRNQLVVLI